MFKLLTSLLIKKGYILADEALFRLSLFRRLKIRYALVQAVQISIGFSFETGETVNIARYSQSL